MAVAHATHQSLELLHPSEDVAQLEAPQLAQALALLDAHGSTQRPPRVVRELELLQAKVAEGRGRPPRQGLEQRVTGHVIQCVGSREREALQAEPGDSLGGGGRREELRDHHRHSHGVKPQQAQRLEARRRAAEQSAEGLQRVWAPVFNLVLECDGQPRQLLAALRPGAHRLCHVHQVPSKQLLEAEALEPRARPFAQTPP